MPALRTIIEATVVLAGRLNKLVVDEVTNVKGDHIM